MYAPSLSARACVCVHCALQALQFLVLEHKGALTLEELSRQICPALNSQQLYRLCTTAWDDTPGAGGAERAVLCVGVMVVGLGCGEVGGLTGDTPGAGGAEGQCCVRCGWSPCVGGGGGGGVQWGRVGAENVGVGGGDGGRWGFGWETTPSSFPPNVCAAVCCMFAQAGMMVQQEGRAGMVGLATYSLLRVSKRFCLSKLCHGTMCST